MDEIKEELKPVRSDPSKVWKEYQEIVQYMTSNDVYNTASKNELFFRGKQWNGVDSTDIAKPVMNKLQRIGKHQISMITSKDVGVSIRSLLGSEDENNRLNIISDQVKDVIEQAKLIESSRLMVRDAFIGGVSYQLLSFEEDYDTGQESKGRIKGKQLGITQVYFGNPYDPDIQTQPFIIVALRQYVGQVREEAQDLGVPNYDEITSDWDSETLFDEEEVDSKLCTVLLKFYKKKHTEVFSKVVFDETTGQEYIVEEEREVKTVHFSKSTRNVVIIDETDLGYTRYPLSRFGWDNRSNSFLYDSPMTENIVNQVFVNKMYSSGHEYVRKNAFPKNIVDDTKLSIEDLESDDTLSIAGIDMIGKVMDSIKAPDFSAQLIPMIELTEKEMERNMGLNDAAMGEVRPDNAAAILALREQASVPLEIVHQNFYEMWEDTVRNIVDIMVCTYDVRKVPYEGELVDVDFNQLKGLNYKLTIDIGSSAQYSEISQLETASNLLMNGKIDLETFVECCPEKFIPNKTALLKFVEKQNQALMQQPMPQIQ